MKSVNENVKPTCLHFFKNQPPTILNLKIAPGMSSLTLNALDKWKNVHSLFMQFVAYHV